MEDKKIEMPVPKDLDQAITQIDILKNSLKTNEALLESKTQSEGMLRGELQGIWLDSHFEKNFKEIDVNTRNRITPFILDQLKNNPMKRATGELAEPIKFGSNELSKIGELIKYYLDGFSSNTTLPASRSYVNQSLNKRQQQIQNKRENR
jgi:hypothetical protein